MFIDGSYRVPTFLYESLWNLVGFSIILGLRYFNKGLRQGDVTSFYLIWYGLGRFVIEGMRTDSLMFVGLRDLTMGQHFHHYPWSCPLIFP